MNQASSWDQANKYDGWYYIIDQAPLTRSDLRLLELAAREEL